MKNFILLLIFSLLINFIQAQTKTCCNMNSATEFAMLGKDSKFTAAHLNPEPFEFVVTTGKMITFDTPDGKKASAFAVMSDKKSENYLFVFHEWWGLNDYIKKETERFAGELGNVNVIALDLYDGKVATTQEEASKYMQAMVQERGEAIIKGAQTYAGNDAKIQTTGWCFGGAWSLQAAILLGKQVTGCVMYYGMPEKDEKKLESLQAPVLGIFAEQDNWITREVVSNFEEKLKSMGKEVTIKFYNADHAFANPSNPKFNRDFAEDAHSNALEFLKKHY